MYIGNIHWKHGSMYIGNTHWKHCRLETSFAFGNMDWILETLKGVWKHHLYIGNISFILETIYLET